METDDKRQYTYPTALTIAGLDPSGGAGLIADVKTFSALGVYGMAAATALTVQNTLGVERVVAVDGETVYRQVAAVMSDIKTDVVKIGMVNDISTVEAIARVVEEYSPKWVVLDPIILSSSGKALMKDEALCAFVKRLLPLSSIVTPNLSEAQRLAEVRYKDNVAAMACAIMAKGAKAVLIKGGHRDGDEKTDLLFTRFSDGETSCQSFTAKTIVTRNTHGTGCTLSSAIAAYLARGSSLVEAVGKAKDYLTRALENGADVKVGNGFGSMNHLFKPEPLIKAHKDC